MKYLPRVLPYLKPYWHLATFMAVLTVVSSVVGLAGPWPLKLVLDNVLGNHPLPAWLAPFFDLEKSRVPLLIAVVMAELLIALSNNVLNVVTEYVSTSLDQWMVLDFRSDLFQHAQRLSLAFHDRRRSGMLIYVINTQGEAATGLVMSIPAIAHSVLTLVGMFWIVFWMDWGLALLAMLVLPFLYFSVRYYIMRIQSRILTVKMMEAESLSIIHEAISMLRVIVAFGREDHEYHRFREQSSRAVRSRVDLTVRQTLFSLAVNMTTAMGTAAVLGYGAYRGLQGQLTGGDLTVVLFYIAAVYKPLEAISYTLGSLQDKFVSLRIAFDLLDSVPEVREAQPAKTMGRACGRIAFQDINFAYEGRTDTLREVSFDVEPGQTVAIVGPTGAGKTTLISLIPRFYDAQRGRILPGRNRYSRVEPPLAPRSSQPGAAGTALVLRFHHGQHSLWAVRCERRGSHGGGPLRQRPRLHHEAAREISDGARRARAQISGGERQRICVARAFLKDAPILILDEPTSAIDSKTEAVILDALDRLMAGRTSFMIAHRLSTVRRADLILVMDQGRIVQRGTHDQLVAVDGVYRQLHEIQTRQARRCGASGSPGGPL